MQALLLVLITSLAGPRVATVRAAPTPAAGTGAVPQQASDQARTQADRPIFRTSVGMTRIKAAVVGPAGKAVSGLAPDDFRVFEDGVERPLELVLDPVRMSIDVALVLDFSESVRRDWSADSARRAAHSFLDELAADDCVFLLPFNRRVGPGVWGHPGDEELRRAVDEAPFEVYTRFYDAVLTAHDALDRRRPDSASAAAEELEDTLSGTWMEPVEPAQCGEPLSPDDAQERRAALVVMTDGEDVGSRAGYSDILLASWRSEVPVFAIAVGMAAATPTYRSTWGRVRDLRPRQVIQSRELWENIRTLREQLHELARVSGGQVVVQYDLEEGYATTLGLLRSYYVLAYRTPEPFEEGWHEIEVELVGHDGDVIVQPGVYRSADAYLGAVTALRDASVQYALGQYEEALGHFDFVAEVSPDVGAPFFGRGLVLEKLGRWTEARDSYRRSLDLRPGSPATHARLAEVNFELADHDRSWEHALRGHLGGVDMNQLFLRLEKVSARPADFDARLAGPTVHLLKPRVPQLEAQIVLRTMMRDVLASLEASPPIAVSGIAAASDYTINVWVRKLDDKEMRARLVVFETESGRTHQEPLDIDDLSDSVAVRSATMRALDDVRAWILERHGDD